MREIKFRAWNRDVEEMIDDICTWTDDFTDMLNETFKYWRDELILLQYTGLKDKNGKEIYEGDIVEYNITPNGETLTGEVFYFPPTFVLTDKTKACAKNYPLPMLQAFNFKVTGNIYENPELIINNK